MPIPRDHLCARPGCSQRIPIELMFCPDDWESLPRELRARVNAAYRAYARQPRERDRLNELAAARKAALEALGVKA